MENNHTFFFFQLKKWIVTVSIKDHHFIMCSFAYQKFLLGEKKFFALCDLINDDYTA